MLHPPTFTHTHTHIHTGSYTDAEKDSIEAEVGLFVKACTKQLEQLRSSIAAAQGPTSSSSHDAQQQKQHGLPRRPRANEQTVAHLHGVVGCG